MKTLSKRVLGFVVGSAAKGSGLVWKVRVKDPTSVHNGEKLEVVSLRPGNELWPSADVTFRVEPILINGEFVFRAAGVNVGTDLVGPERQPQRDVSEGSDTFNVCATEHLETGEVTVFCTGLETLDQAKQEIERDGVEKVVGFEAINMAPADQSDETHTGLQVLKSLTYVDGPLQAFDHLLTRTFKLGQDSHKS